MAKVDLVIIIGLIFFVYWGLRKGFKAEMLGFTGWIIALLIGLALADKASSLLGNKIPSIQKVSWILAFFAIIILVRLFLLLIFQRKAKSETASPPSKLDRFGGAVLGFLEGAFVISVLLIAIAILPIKGNLKQYENRSLLYPHLKDFSVYIVETVAKYVPLTQKGVDMVLQKFEKEKQNIPTSKDELDKMAADKVTESIQNAGDKLTKEEIRKILLNDKSQREKDERGPRR
ncbi:MAG: hypothetical protein GWP06_09660 [Actinobacteria bacterium]|nr:hypothetical protein [Actinomycetota bacterium]